ncbi:Solute carrier family 35 member G1 [Holothuria leucospilota]|uniref:Solute carrier family 35 member G1 n=1 Tax=Holothuria leucospilota TaxID=206669 RepID=A0A9Q1C5G7_HOLLE|nr:Solute carrier family 35 member G1 [Holothuria leucospilota]
MEGKEAQGSDTTFLEELTSGVLDKDNICQPDARKISNARDQTRSANVWWLIFRHRGVAFVLLASFFSALHSVLARFVKEDMHPIQISFTRFLHQLLFALPVLTFSGISPKPESKAVLFMLIARGVVGTIALTSFFYAFQYTSVGDATAVVFGSPVFVGMFARIFLKEPFGILDFMLVVIVIGGVFLISQPPFLFGGEEGERHSTEYIGALFALGTCICVSLTTILMGKMGKLHINTFKIVLYYAALATSTTALLTTIFQVWSMPSCGIVRFALVGMGVLNFFSQCLITYSLSLERSVFVSILRANEVIFAYLLEFSIFGVTPSIIPLIGVILVLSGSILASLKKMWLSRKKGVAKRRQSELSNRIAMELS